MVSSLTLARFLQLWISPSQALSKNSSNFLASPIIIGSSLTTMPTLQHHFIRSFKKSFQWSNICQQAFDALKSKLTTSPILGYPDFTCSLSCTLTHLTLLLVLSLVNSNMVKKVISYWSCQLTKAERNYSTIEWEALAVVGAVKEFTPISMDFILN